MALAGCMESITIMVAQGGQVDDVCVDDSDSQVDWAPSVFRNPTGLDPAREKGQNDNTHQLLS